MASPRETSPGTRTKSGQIIRPRVVRAITRQLEPDRAVERLLKEMCDEVDDINDAAESGVVTRRHAVLAEVAEA